MNLEDQMNVARDADRMSKKDLKNAKERARRAAKKAMIAMNAEMAVASGAMAFHTADSSVAAAAKQDKVESVETPLSAPIPSAEHIVDEVAESVATEAVKPAKFGRKNTFIPGTSTFKCESCGRLTRFTGEQSMGSKICPECHTIAGEVNHLSDNGKLYDNPELILSMFAEIQTKGGTVPAYFAQVEELAKAASELVSVEATKSAKVSVKKAVLDLFYAVPGTVYSTQDAIAAIQAAHSGMNESSIRVWITDFQKDGSIINAGRDGRKVMLKSGTPGKFAKGYVIAS